MTTPTTNFGWLKPDPDEPVSVSNYNQWLDDFDADMKTRETAEGIEIPYMCEYGLYEGTGYLAGDDQYASSANTTAEMKQTFKWVKHWEPFYSNSGGFEIDETVQSRFKFTATGIYRVTYSFAFYNTTGITGYIRKYIRNVTQAADLVVTNSRVRAQSLVGTTAFSHSSYIKVTSSAGTVNVNDVLAFFVGYASTDSAALTYRINATDDEWIRPRMQIEWVRPV